MPQQWINPEYAGMLDDFQKAQESADPDGPGPAPLRGFLITSPSSAGSDQDE